MTDEEKAAVEAENSTEQTPAEPAAPADDGNNFGESAEDNFGGGFEDNFGLGDDALAAGTIPQAPSAVKKKPPVTPVTPRNRDNAASAILSGDPSSLANAASVPGSVLDEDDEREPVLSVNTGMAPKKMSAASGVSGVISVNTGAGKASPAKSGDTISVNSDMDGEKPKSREDALFEQFQLMRVPPKVCKYAARFRVYLPQHPDAVKNLEALFEGDEASIGAIRRGLKCLEAFPTPDFANVMFYYPLGLTTEEERKDWDSFVNNYEEYVKLTKGEYPYFDPSQFYYHHGAIYLDAAVKDRLAGGVFYQCGAFCGASLIAMSQYKPAKMIGFEPSEGNVMFLQANLARAELEKSCNLDMYKLFMAERVGRVAMQDHDKDGKPCRTEVQATTLDIFEQKKAVEGRVAWIQADVGGMGRRVILGAETMIKRDKPLVTVAIHHNPEEFFGIAPLLKEWVPEYKFMIRRCQCNPAIPYGDITLIAYVQ
jgi:FkbM family methyltransferase